MSSIPFIVYVGAVFALFLKTIASTLVQAKERLGSKKFAYPEDAAHWKGTQQEDTELCQRAQRVLRNDSETQPWFVVFGALYVVLGAWPTGAFIYFPLYVLSRVFHTLWLLNPKQPHRNRAFGLGLSVLVIVAVHVVIAAASALGA